MLGRRPLALIQARQRAKNLDVVGGVVEHRADGGDGLIRIVKLGFQNGSHAVAQLVASCRLDHLRAATQKLDPFARLARLLEDAFQVLEGFVRCFAFAVEQAAVAGHGCREIAQGVLFQICYAQTKRGPLVMILAPFTAGSQHVDQALDVGRLGVKSLKRRGGRGTGPRVAEVQVEHAPPSANGRAAIRERALEEPGCARQQVGDSGDVRGIAFARKFLVQRLQIVPAPQNARQPLGLQQGRLGLRIQRQHGAPGFPGRAR